MEEQVATSLDHSLILDYRVLCDDQSTFTFIYGDKSLNYSNQGVSKLPGLGYTIDTRKEYGLETLRNVMYSA